MGVSNEKRCKTLSPGKPQVISLLGKPQVISLLGKPQVISLGY